MTSKTSRRDCPVHQRRGYVLLASIEELNAFEFTLDGALTVVVCSSSVQFVRKAVAFIQNSGLDLYGLNSCSKDYQGWRPHKLKAIAATMREHGQQCNAELIGSP